MSLTPDSSNADAGPPAREAVLELVSLLLDTSSVEDFLDDLARLAASSFTDAPVACGITLRRDGQPLTVASSDDLALAVDEAQYGKGAGPCLEAMDTGAVVLVSDLTSETRWEGYTAHALAHGVASSLSLPLSAEGRTVGAMNLYAQAAHAFDGPATLAQGTSFAAQGSAVLTVVLRQARQAQLTEQLRETLVSRAVIDQAIGIIMAQQRCPAGQAFGYLRTASQNRNRKLRDIAADVITSATGAPPQPTPFTDPR
jgi:GAF domain-containing protein